MGFSYLLNSGKSLAKILNAVHILCISDSLSFNTNFLLSLSVFVIPRTIWAASNN